MKIHPEMIGLLLPLVFLLGVIGCAKAPETPPAPPQPPVTPDKPGPSGEVTLEMTIQNTTFDKKALTVPADAKVKLAVTSKETQLDYHNFALYKDRTAKEAIYVGDYLDGGQTTIYQFTAPGTPGTYFYRCDTHPFLMNGQFIVE